MIVVSVFFDEASTVTSVDEQLDNELNVCTQKEWTCADEKRPSSGENKTGLGIFE